MLESINFANAFYLLLGSFFLVRNVSLYFNPEAIHKYIEVSPKAYIWRKAFGVEKTVKLTKFIFLPLGTLLSLYIIIMALVSMMYL